MFSQTHTSHMHSCMHTHNHRLTCTHNHTSMYTYAQPPFCATQCSQKKLDTAFLSTLTEKRAASLHSPGLRAPTKASGLGAGAAGQDPVAFPSVSLWRESGQQVGERPQGVATYKRTCTPAGSPAPKPRTSTNTQGSGLTPELDSRAAHGSPVLPSLQDPGVLFPPHYWGLKADLAPHLPVLLA